MLKRFLDRLSKDGKLLPDPTPKAPAVRMTRSVTDPYIERLQEYLRSERLARLAAVSGAETFEEADDFADDEDGDWPRSVYEELDDDGPTAEETLGRANDQRGTTYIRKKDETNAIVQQVDLEEAIEAERAKRRAHSQVPAEPAREALDDAQAPENGTGDQ